MTDWARVSPNTRMDELDVEARDTLDALCGLAERCLGAGSLSAEPPGLAAFLASAERAHTTADVEYALRALSPLYRAVADWPPPPPSPLPACVSTLGDADPSERLTAEERRLARMLAAAWLLAALALGPRSVCARKVAICVPVLATARTHGTFIAALDAIDAAWDEADDPIPRGVG